MDSYLFYVPSKFVPMLKPALRRWHGGYTILPGAEGAWIDSEGRTHLDDITLVEVFSPDSTVVRTVVNHLLFNGELAVAFKVNGVPRIVEAGDDY